MRGFTLIQLFVLFACFACLSCSAIAQVSSSSSCSSTQLWDPVAQRCLAKSMCNRFIATLHNECVSSCYINEMEIVVPNEPYNICAPKCSQGFLINTLSDYSCITEAQCMGYVSSYNQTCTVGCNSNEWIVYNPISTSIKQCTNDSCGGIYMLNLMTNQCILRSNCITYSQQNVCQPNCSNGYIPILMNDSDLHYTCVPSDCPNYYGVLINLSDGSCIRSDLCTGVISSNGQYCSTTCQPGEYIKQSVQQYCSSDCFDASYVLNTANNTCIRNEQCTQVISEGTCTATCQQGWIAAYTQDPNSMLFYQQCYESCPVNFITLTSNNSCITPMKCTQFLSSDGKSCASSCQTGDYTYQDPDLPYVQCLLQCFEGINSGQQLLLNGPNNTCTPFYHCNQFISSNLKNCNSSCNPGENIYTIITGNKVCVTQCSQFHLLQGPNNTCVDFVTCSQVISTNFECVASCNPGEYQYSYVYGNNESHRITQCFQTCFDGLLNFASENTCISRYACPYLVSADGMSCILECPAGQIQIINYGIPTCANKCPQKQLLDLRLYNLTCIPISECSNGYISADLTECNNYCKYGENPVQDTNQCLMNCPFPKQYSNEEQMCISPCPVGQIINNYVCSTTCDKLISSDGSTCDWSCLSNEVISFDGTHCISCGANGVASKDMMRCITPCGEGYIPQEGNTSCVACGSNQVVSQDGNSCVLLCGSSSVPSSNGTSCVACGQNEVVSRDGSKCVPSCPPRNILSSNSTQCIACASDEYISFYGNSCVSSCQGGAISADMTRCVYCTGPMVASLDGLSCILACPHGSVASSDNTECITCSQNQVYNQINNLCVPLCPTGFAPSGNGQSCQQFCGANQILESGQCIPSCSGWFVLSANRQSCVLLCPSPIYVASSNGKECIPTCSSTQVVSSDKTQCVPCGTNYVASQDRTKCILSCGVRQVPSIDMNTCITCSANQIVSPYSNYCQNCPDITTVSNDGTSCVISCQTGYILTSDQTRCIIACTAGMILSSDGSHCISSCASGQVTSANGTQCIQCQSNQIISNNTCMTCVSPQIVSTDGTRCVLICSSGFTPSSNGTMCNPICGTNQILSSDGTMCIIICAQRQVPSTDGTTCISCLPNEVVSSNGESCITCVSPKIVSNTGTICVLNCPSGQTPSFDETSCVLQCGANQILSIDGTQCLISCPVGQVISSDGSGCEVLCTHGQIQSTNRQTCITCGDLNEFVSLDGTNCVKSCSEQNNQTNDGVQCQICDPEQKQYFLQSSFMCTNCTMSFFYMYQGKYICTNDCDEGSVFSPSSNGCININACPAQLMFTVNQNSQELICSNQCKQGYFQLPVIGCVYSCLPYLMIPDATGTFCQPCESGVFSTSSQDCVSNNLASQQQNIQNMISSTSFTVEQKNQVQQTMGSYINNLMSATVVNPSDLQGTFNLIVQVTKSLSNDIPMLFGNPSTGLVSVAQIIKSGFMPVTAFSLENVQNSSTNALVQPSTSSAFVSKVVIASVSKNIYCTISQCSGMQVFSAAVQSPQRLLQSSGSSGQQFTINFAVPTNMNPLTTICANYNPTSSMMSINLSSTQLSQDQKTITCSFTSNASLYSDTSCTYVNKSICASDSSLGAGYIVLIVLGSIVILAGIALAVKIMFAKMNAKKNLQSDSSFSINESTVDRNSIPMNSLRKQSHNP